MKDEIIKIQEMITHQNEDINRLSHELYMQQKEVLSLSREVKYLRDQIKRIKNNGDDDIRPFSAQDDKPPHY